MDASATSIAAPPAGSRNATLDVEVPPGLKGIRVASTAIGDVRGAEGFFHYRQYDATELASTRTLEAIWHHVLLGSLPADAAAGAEWRARVGSMRASGWADVRDAVAAVVPTASTEVDVLAALRAVLALLAAHRPFAPWIDLDPDELLRHALTTAAITPVAVAAVHRAAHGLDPIAPDQRRGHAEDYLRMVTGDNAPDPVRVRSLEQYLALTIDHGFNASTFTARVVASTGTDLTGAIVAALGSLAGPLHGGAPSRALAMVDEIGTVDNAEPWLRATLGRGERLMGFGHAVYTTTDPRSRLLASIADEIGGEQVALARHVEAVAERLLEEQKPGRGLRTNVEFYAALVMRGAGLPDELFTPTFAVSRVIGWTAHVIEQAAANRIFRPAATYIGPDAPVPVPSVAHG